jgi:putative endonuclease
MAAHNDLGHVAEQLAARFLLSQGLELVERNFRRRVGEIDLIARNDTELLIIEVRTRSSESFGGAATSVDRRKQMRIIRATALLLQRHREFARLRVRFDVIVVSNALGDNPRIRWIRHAFT